MEGLDYTVSCLESSIASLKEARESIADVTADTENFKESLKNEQVFTVVPYHDFVAKKQQYFEALNPQIVTTFKDMDRFVQGLIPKRDQQRKRSNLLQERHDQTHERSLTRTQEDQEELNHLEQLRSKKVLLQEELQKLQALKQS